MLFIMLCMNLFEILIYKSIDFRQLREGNNERYDSHRAVLDIKLPKCYYIDIIHLKFVN